MILVYPDLPSAVDETRNAAARVTKTGPTVVRGVLVLSELGGNGDSPPERENARYSPHFPATPRAVLLDVSGRKVLDLYPGVNDVRALVPGVYFVKDEPQATSFEPQAVRKVVVTR